MPCAGCCAITCLRAPFALAASTIAKKAQKQPLLTALLCVVQPKDWGIRMNKKERRLALATALQSANGNTTIVQDLKVSSLLQSAALHARTVAARTGSIHLCYRIAVPLRLL